MMYNKAKSRERQTDNNGSCKQADSIKTNLTILHKGLGE